MHPSSGAAPKVNTNASMVYWRGFLLFYGGYYNESFLDKDQTTHLSKYDFKNETWINMGDGDDLTMSEFGMQVYQDTLFTFQGASLDEGSWLSVYKLKLDDHDLYWEEVSYNFTRSHPRYSYAMDELNGKVWFFGGFSSYYSKGQIILRNDVMVADLCMHYTAKSELVFELATAGYDSISPRAGHSLIPIADQLLTFGGRDGTSV
jgi:hypothetical protein